MDCTQLEASELQHRCILCYLHVHHCWIGSGNLRDDYSLNICVFCFGDHITKSTFIYFGGFSKYHIISSFSLNKFFVSQFAREPRGTTLESILWFSGPD